MDDFGPYDPTLEYSAQPAIKELSPDGVDVPIWRPLNMTRRSFLRGVVCSGIVIAGSAYIFSHPTKARADARAVERLVTLSVNGRKRQVEAPPNETLAYTLRYRLGLTGNHGVTMDPCAKSLLDGIIDYAGLFPPAQLPMDEAFARFVEHRLSDDGWMLARFVCAATAAMAV